MTATPPRNLSAIDGHPWFDGYWVHFAEIRIDGATVSGVITASMDEGWADVVVNPVRDDGAGNVVTERRHGVVEILADEQVSARERELQELARQAWWDTKAPDPDEALAQAMAERRGARARRLAMEPKETAE